MTIFIAFAEADRDTATALDRFLERRGHFTELDNGETVLREVEPADVVIAIISEAFAQSEYRLRLEQRALDAWSEGRLVLVRDERHPAPVGLRDLPYIALEPGDEEITWGSVQAALVEPSAEEQAKAERDSPLRRMPRITDPYRHDPAPSSSPPAALRLILPPL